jgi:hypothetical protein
MGMWESYMQRILNKLQQEMHMVINNLEEIDDENFNSKLNFISS